MSGRTTSTFAPCPRWFCGYGGALVTSPLAGFSVDPDLDAAPRAAPPSKRRAAPTETEASVKDRIMRRIRARGGYVIAKHMTGLGVRGTPDLMACIGGRMVVIEVKADTKVPTPAQFGELRRWQTAGALAGWARTEGQLDQLLDHLVEPGWRNTLEHPGDGRDAGESW